MQCICGCREFLFKRLDLVSLSWLWSVPSYDLRSYRALAHPIVDVEEEDQRLQSNAVLLERISALPRRSVLLSISLWLCRGAKALHRGMRSSLSMCRVCHGQTLELQPILARKARLSVGSLPICPLPPFLLADLLSIIEH